MNHNSCAITSPGAILRKSLTKPLEPECIDYENWYGSLSKPLGWINVITKHILMFSVKMHLNVMNKEISYIAAEPIPVYCL